MAYDFMPLSPLDFEALVRDLLQEEWSLHLESFTSGADKGIDLRYVPVSSDSSTTIVQCKRYQPNSFASLKSNLVNKELPKIKSLAPDRYVLATSVRMTPHRKDDLVDVLKPFVRGPADVFGSEDLNNLLGRHPGVERAHFKLWLTSTEVLSAILSTVVNNDIQARTAAVLDDIQEKASLFVTHDGYYQAQEKLSTDGACIISGAPGVGKTILGKMLLLSQVNEGYEPVVLTSILEADRLYSTGKAQVFFFDDFLGTVSLAEPVGGIQDAHIADFVHRIAKSKNKRLILTTREHILSEAATRYARLRANPELDGAKYILDLEQYSRLNRAHILYNHLFFGPVAHADYRCLLKDSRYEAVVDHSNYSPRLIETVLNLVSGGHKGDEDFCEFVDRVFAHPEELWAHAYDNQLSEIARAVLVALLTLPRVAPLQSTRRATQALLDTSDPPPLEFQHEFIRALKVLEPTFLRVSREEAGTESRLLFSSPSVRDFMQSRLTEGAIDPRSLMARTVYFEQAQFLLGVESEGHGPSRDALKEAITAMTRTFELQGATLSELSCERELALIIAAMSDLETGSDVDWLVQAAQAIARRWEEGLCDVDATLELLEGMPRVDESELTPALEPLEGAARGLFLNDLSDSSSVARACRLRDVRPDLFDDLDEFDKQVVESYEREIKDLGYIDNPDDIGDPDELKDWLEDLETIEVSLDLAPAEGVVRAREVIAYFDYEPDDDYERWSFGGSGVDPDTSEGAQIADMFSTLNDVEPAE